MKYLKNPLIVALILCLGIVLGVLLANLKSQEVNLKAFQPKQSDNKISELTNILDKFYVDTINVDNLTEDALMNMLSSLDPHSRYIPKEDLQVENEHLDGEFSGIGVQFNLMQDTIYVVDVISGGPSERAGMMPGDRIISVNDTAFVGKEINNEKVFKKLRGPKGTDIKLGVVRKGTPEILYYEITRADIPINTVDVSYLITPEIGHISINSFGAKTYAEFLAGMGKIYKSGARKVIIDLRGNSGGYLDAVINMVNEFLSKGSLITYIEGRAYPRSESRATGTGSFQDMKIAVLIDEFSASASEIFAGAMQDNDRAVIIGRRSFGKGLVQQPFDFKDGSEARITIARYYTPSGRCIQKPYTLGENKDYETDILKRFEHGEFFSADSIHFADSLMYKTVGGRTVYGGGGIMPDIFVPRDTTEISQYFTKLVNKNLIYKFSLQYTENHRAELKSFSSWQTMSKELDSRNMFNQLVAYAAKEGVKGSDKDKKNSYRLINEHIYSYIIRNILGDEEFYPFIYQNDITVKRAIEELSKE